MALRILRSPLCVPLALALGACAADATTSPDGADDVGLGAGKADGSEFSDCELAAVVDHLNAGATVAELEEGGVHTLAAENIVLHRDGDDGLYGTDDDDLFDDIVEVDDVLYVGPVAMQQLVAIVAEGCAEPDEPADPWALARDVDLALVAFPPEMPAPASYDYPDAERFYLSGTEFWQKWSGGHSPTYSFSEGTAAGRTCMQASAIRFEAIMADPPAELVELMETTSWGGSFFNWNDDYSQADWGDGSGARLWAWRTGLIKWISQTNRDGSCYLPTRELVARAATDCLATAARNAGTDDDAEIQGCSAR